APVDEVGDVGGGPAADRLQLDPRGVGEDALAAAGDERGDVQPQLINEAGGEVLVEGAGPAGDRDVLLPRRLSRPLERRLDPVADEVVAGAAFHLDTRAGTVAEDEYRCVVGRVGSPPATPVEVPLAAVGPEHVAPHDE